MTLSRFGLVLIFVALLSLVASRPAAPRPPCEMAIDRDDLKGFGVFVKIVGEEMIAAAGSENIEEHLIVKSERIFDDFARDADFPGPDRLSKPIARRMVRPVVKAVIRYMDKKGKELSLEGDFNDE